MAEAMQLPYEYVDLLRHPGLTCDAGNVALDAYLCQTASNGGSDNAKSLLGALRWKKDGGSGPTLNALAGSIEMDLALKGQGTHATFVTIWDFMCRNRTLLKSIKIDVLARRGSDGTLGRVLKTGNVHELYFAGRSDKAALEAMIDDRFFGIDCIGFAANYLRWVGEWSEYHGATPTQWAMWHCTQPVDKVADIKALDFLIWDGHIALVDWVWNLHGKDMIMVDVCQSSAGGPQCNEFVFLREAVINGQPRFKIEHRGTPAMPVHSACRIMRRKGFFW